LAAKVLWEQKARQDCKSNVKAHGLACFANLGTRVTNQKQTSHFEETFTIPEIKKSRWKFPAAFVFQSEIEIPKS